MRRSQFILLSVCALVWLGMNSPVEAQNRRRGSSALRQGRIPSRSFHSVGTGGRQALGTFGSNRYQGIQTRAQILRSMSPLQRYEGGLLSPAPYPSSPITQLLNQRNLLKARSPLAYRASAMVGRYPIPSVLSVGDEAQFTTRSAGDSSSETEGAVADKPGQYEDLLAARLDSRAAEAFNLGAAFYRSGDFSHAHHSFDMAQQVWSDRPQPFLGAMLTSYSTGRYQRATTELVKAIERMEELDDLKIEGFVENFFEGADLSAKQAEFRKTVDSVNVFVVSTHGSPRANLLLAYFAWLNGDLGTAIAAAELAPEGFREELQEPIRKFHELLIQEQLNATTRTE